MFLNEMTLRIKSGVDLEIHNRKGCANFMTAELAVLVVLLLHGKRFFLALIGV